MKSRRWLPALLFSLLLFACDPVAPLDSAQLQRAYGAAVQDAEIALPQEVSRQLTAIVPWNDELIWSTDKTRVLMVSWMSQVAADRFYRPALQNDGGRLKTTTAAGVYSWVTAAPELKRYASKFIADHGLTTGGPQLHLRLQQLLGLPPKEGANAFVELWIKPADLFRPCLDKEIVDNECVVDASDVPDAAGYNDMFNFLNVDPDHRKWFVERKAASYWGANPFPWTRLGYSYDWADENAQHIGASEFVVKQGSDVVIADIVTTDDYPLSPIPST